MKTVDFYFDFISPYSYLAWTRLSALTDRGLLKLRFKPILFAGLLDRWEHKGPAEIPPKRVFLVKDCLRQAAKQKVAFQFPKTHPFNPLTALRLALQEVAGDQQEAIIKTLWHAAWVDGIDMGSSEELAQALESAGYHASDLLQIANSPTAKAALRAQTEEAIKQEVFGVPSFVVEGEVFWGNDRMDDLLIFLEGKDPIDPQILKANLARQAGAQRKAAP